MCPICLLPCYRGIFLYLLTLLSAITVFDCRAVEIQPVMGAGPSTVVVRSFFRDFSSIPAADGYEFVVEQRSIKHAGGINASGKYLFGRTGRPLSAPERAMDKHDLLIARIPIVFVIGRKTGIRRITLEQLNAVFSGKIDNWKQLGGVDAEIVVAGREPTEAALSVLKSEYSVFNQAEFDLVLTRDHQLVNLIRSSAGDYVIGFGVRTNFNDDQILHVDGFSSGIKLGLVYDEKNKNHAVVRAAIDFASSKNWRQRVVESNLLPIDD